MKIKKGQIKQCIIPDDLDLNTYSLSLEKDDDLEQGFLGFQIGFSIEEKAFMQIANHPISNIPKNISMILNFSDGTSINNEIEIGRTYMYEPGDLVNLSSISFDKNQWDEVIKDEETNLPKFKGYLEIIATSQNTKNETDYLDQQEEF